jgi:hypothetical protein
MSENADFSRFNRTFDVPDAYISPDGYYTCEHCDAVLEATGEIGEKEPGEWGRYAIFECPECYRRSEI